MPIPHGINNIKGKGGFQYPVVRVHPYPPQSSGNIKVILVQPAVADKKKKKGVPLKHDPTFTGPLKNRSCTDVICLLIFLAFIGGWIAVAVIAYKTGDPQRLLYPTDSQGLRCGVDHSVRDKPNLFFFDLTKCASPTVIATGCPTPQICVEKCPDHDFLAKPYLLTRQNLEKLKQDLICKYEVNKVAIKTYDEVATLIKDNKCAAWYMASTPLASRCLPTILHSTTAGAVTFLVNGQNITSNDVYASDLLNATATIAALASIEEFGERLLQDMTASWPLIFAGLCEAALLSFVYIIIMRWIAAPMVWISLIGLIVLLSYGIYACHERWQSLDSFSQSQLPTPQVSDVFNGNFESYFMVKETWLVLMIICCVLLTVVVLITLFLRSRLRIAIALIREASQAVGSAMSTLFFPIVPWLLHLGVLTFGVSVLLFLASSGTKEYRVAGYRNSSCNCPAYKDGVTCDVQTFDTECRLASGFAQHCSNVVCTFYTYRTDPYIGWFHTYNVIGFFWAAFFVSAFGEMVLAGTFSTWYWTYRKADLPYFMLTGALLRTMRYHLGTLAFGSLIITICRMIRLVLEYIDQKLKKYADYQIVKFIMCCCKCCFWCLEKFLLFLNRNAYIMCAVHGKNFCTSAREAFMLLMRNVVRVVVLDKVTDFLLFLGKLLITLGIVVQWFFIFSHRLDPINKYVPNLNYYMAPVIIIGVGTYFIATVFFSVYNMAVDTLFLCFLEDCERNDGSAEKPYFMSSKLMKILKKKNKTE